VTAATEFVHRGDAMGIAVEGVDRRHPPDAALARSLRRALLDNLVPCIRGQSIGPGEFHAAIATFGTPRLRPEIPNVPGFPTVTTLSSTDRDTAGGGKRLVAGEEWPAFCYRHKWRRGDIVFWDDRCTMHKANGDYPRAPGAS
jgi:alpha-ketoglutarate-dependent taurine dioxygenase